MSFSDRTLTCRDCGQQFTFTAEVRGKTGWLVTAARFET